MKRSIFFALITFLIVIAIQSDYVFAQGSFGTGFQIGSQIGAQALSSSANEKRAQAEESARRQQLIRQYGRPALERIDALEKDADRWAAEMALSLKEMREKSKSRNQVAQ